MVQVDRGCNGGAVECKEPRQPSITCPAGLLTPPLSRSNTLWRKPATAAAAVFTTDTTDAELEANVTAATKALLTPLVESTMLPQYAAGLRQRVAGEVQWLQSFVEDPSKQSSLCGMFGAATKASCVNFAASMQRAKVQALQAALAALTQIEAQINTELAAKVAAFDVVRFSFLALLVMFLVVPSWLCLFATRRNGPRQPHSH